MIKKEKKNFRKMFIVTDLVSLRIYKSINVNVTETIFSEKNITLDSLNNPDMLGEFLNALSSLDDHMETYVKNFIIPAVSRTKLTL